MKTLALVTTAATSVIATAILAIAIPTAAALERDSLTAVSIADAAKGGLDHVTWLDDIRPNVTVPKVDTRVQQSR